MEQKDYPRGFFLFFWFFFMAVSAVSCGSWHLHCGVSELSLWYEGFFLVLEPMAGGILVF